MLDGSGNFSSPSAEFGKSCYLNIKYTLLFSHLSEAQNLVKLVFWQTGTNLCDRTFSLKLSLLYKQLSRPNV